MVGIPKALPSWEECAGNLWMTVSVLQGMERGAESTMAVRKKSSRKQERLSREEWLQKALEVLSREGESKLRIDRICQALGVTKGRFYWHFAGRTEFLEAILDYWARSFNQRVPETVEAHGGDARERLRFLFTMVTKENLGRYDNAFDAWAAHEPGIADLVRKVYRLRWDYVGSLFRELGYRGVELEVRTAAFLSYLKVETQVTGKPPVRRSPQRIETELEMFAGPAPA